MEPESGLIKVVFTCQLPLLVFQVWWLKVARCIDQLAKRSTNRCHTTFVRTHRKTLSVCVWTGRQVKMKTAQFVSSENLHCHVNNFCEPAVTHIVPSWFDYPTIHVNLFMVTLWRDKTFDNYFSVVMRSNWVFLCTCKGEGIQPAKQIISIYFDYQIRNKVTEYIRSHWQNGILNWLFWRQDKINQPSCTGGDKKKNPD